MRCYAMMINSVTPRASFQSDAVPPPPSIQSDRQALFVDGRAMYLTRFVLLFFLVV